VCHFPLLLGHRGARASAGVVENSFASFDLALEHGCDGFEFDVRLTACGRALVCHDPRVAGMSISRATCDQLPHLPELHTVFERYGARVFLDIELKVRNLETKVLSALGECPPERGYVVSSFLPEVVMEMKARSAVVPVGLVCQRLNQLARWPTLAVDYVIAHQSLLDRKLVEEVHQAKKKIFVWTVNDSIAMLRFAEWGTDGIISDDTQLLVNTLRPPDAKA
jgi:glycerophosphoryl diester phosphodiesterase